MSANTAFKQRLREYRERVEKALDRWLPAADRQPDRLHQAMRYAVLNGGKRIRPVLVYATGEALGGPADGLDGPACALELIHAYSLVHDDLPAMDDDDLRRGIPTCHRAFDEATAILVGDALQTLAFEILAEDPALADSDPRTRLAMIALLARASGSQGMVGGQAIDLAAVGQRLDLTQLEHMHRHKTGALIRASVELGALAAGCQDEELLQNLRAYARCIGLAFQVRDDILDIEGDTAVIGKTQGADMARNKPTYPALLGLAGAKATAQRLHQEALDALAGLDQRADTLRQISAYIVQRES